ncbi:MAG: heavy metal sensor histidine kinase [Burkholderiales bacterium]|jgi:two-component system heavy metal sensor histidine kinase CusS
MMRPRSITFRLTLFFSTASTAVLLVIGYLAGTLVEAHFEQLDLMELDGKLELVRHTLAKAHTAAGMAAVPEKLSDALVGHHALTVAVVGPDRKPLFLSSGAAFPASLIERGTTEDASGREHPVVWEQDGQGYRGIAGTAVTGIAGQPPMTVAVAVNTEHHRVFMQTFHRRLWLAIGASIALTALLGWIAARRGLAPVHELARLTHGISISRLGERLPPQSVPTELVDLAIAFNDMLARLEGSFRRLTDFSSDLAHELRTPISNLMTETQVALSKARSAEQYREVLYSNLEEYERLARMIADMLFLAKADNGLIVPRSEPVDLAAEVRDLFGYYEAFAEEQGVSLALGGTGSIQGDRLMMRRALSNLLSNAIRHTPRGGAVAVRVGPRPSGEIELSVENPGADIAPEHLPRLFDRFYRVDPSRHKAPSEGAGLGLAITKSIVEAHKGSIRISSADGTTRFDIAFPAAGAERRAGPHTTPAQQDWERSGK